LSTQDSFTDTNGFNQDLMPRSRILDPWLNDAWSDGLQIETVDDFTEIHVETHNSVYEFTVIDGRSRSIVVRGGRFFAERTPATLAGCSLGGSFLKLGGIYVGFSLEIVYSKDTVITTHVKSIKVYETPKFPSES